MFSKNKVGKHLQVWMVLVFKLLNKSWYLGIKKQGLISWTTANSPMGSLDFLKVCMCFFHVIIFQWCCNVIMWPRARADKKCMNVMWFLIPNHVMFTGSCSPAAKFWAQRFIWIKWFDTTTCLTEGKGGPFLSSTSGTSQGLSQAIVFNVNALDESSKPKLFLLFLIHVQS